MKKLKIKFKRLKNKKEAVYQTPGFLEKAGILQVSESGLFMHNGNLFSKVYERKQPENGEALLKEQALIRKLDVTWSYLSISDSSKTWYARFCLSAENFEKAQEKFQALEGELSRILQIRGMLLAQRLTTGLCKIQKYFCVDGVEMEICSLENAEDWKSYAELDFIQDKINSFETLKGCFAFLSVNEYPSILKDEKRHSLYSVLREIPGVLGMQSTFEPITDFAVSSFMQEKYIGYESVLSKMKRVNPALYHVVAEPVEIDNRSFFCGSSVFLLYAKEQSELYKNIASFVIRAGSLGYLVQNISGIQSQLIRDFFFLDCGLGQTMRFLPMSQMASLLPVVFEEKESQVQAAEEADLEEMRKLFLG